MKYVNVFLFFFIPVFSYSQSYTIGSDPKYHLEDSLFMDWQKNVLNHKFKPMSDSMLSTVKLIGDSTQKLIARRNISGIYLGPRNQKDYYDSLTISLSPELIKQFKDQHRSDTSVKTSTYFFPKDIDQ